MTSVSKLQLTWFMALLLVACGGVSTEQTESPDAGDTPTADAATETPDATLEPDAQALGPAQMIFVSSIDFGANFGGLDGADAACQERANRGGIGGSWQAVLEDVDTPLRDRLDLRGPVIDRSGNLLAATPDDFFAGNLLGPNLGTETNNPRPDPTVAWLGAGGIDCENWTVEDQAINGSLTFASGTNWTRLDANTSCVARLALQCLELPDDA